MAVVLDSVAMPPQPQKCMYFFPDTQFPPLQMHVNLSLLKNPDISRSPDHCSVNLRPGHAPARCSRGAHKASWICQCWLVCLQRSCSPCGRAEPRGSSCCLTQAWNQSACIPAPAPRQPQPGLTAASWVDPWRRILIFML